MSQSRKKCRHQETGCTNDAIDGGVECADCAPQELSLPTGPIAIAGREVTTPLIE